MRGIALRGIEASPRNGHASQTKYTIYPNGLGKENENPDYAPVELEYGTFTFIFQFGTCGRL